MNPNTCPTGQTNGGNTIVIVPQEPNLVINGAMKVAQRGTSFTAVSATQYTLDRWELEFSGSPSAVVTVSQATDAPTGAGFGNSLKIGCTTAEAAVAATEAIVLKTTIEAQDLQQLMYGDDANNQSTSLSFWVKSPKAGTHCVALYMDDGSAHLIQEFVVIAANAWEPKHIVFPGCPTWSIANDNGAGLTISFPLVAGTDFQGTKDVWETGNDYATADQQNLLDSTANNFCITGVKFEVGEVATVFERESVGDTLLKCQRYFLRFTDSTQARYFAGFQNLTSRGLAPVAFPVTMRTTPTTANSAVTDFAMFYLNTSIVANVVDGIGGGATPQGATLLISHDTAGTAGNGALAQLKVGSELDYDAEF